MRLFLHLFHSLENHAHSSRYNDTLYYWAELNLMKTSMSSYSLTFFLPFFFPPRIHPPLPTPRPPPLLPFPCFHQGCTLKNLLLLLLLFKVTCEWMISWSQVLSLPRCINTWTLVTWPLSGRQNSAHSSWPIAAVRGGWKSESVTEERRQNRWPVQIHISPPTCLPDLNGFVCVCVVVVGRGGAGSVLP